MDPTPNTDVDAWADALLDQHRTMSSAEIRRLNEPAPLDDLPTGTRLMLRIGGAHPTRDQAERMKRTAKRFAFVAKWDAFFSMVGVFALLVFAFVYVFAF